MVAGKYIISRRDVCVAASLYASGKKTFHCLGSCSITLLTERCSAPDKPLVAENRSVGLLDDPHSPIEPIIAEFAPVVSLRDGHQPILGIPLKGDRNQPRFGNRNQFVQRIMRELACACGSHFRNPVLRGIVGIGVRSHSRPTLRCDRVGQLIGGIVIKHPLNRTRTAALLSPVGDLTNRVVVVGET